MYRIVFSAILLIAAVSTAVKPVAAAGEGFTVAVPVLEKPPSLTGTLDDSWMKAVHVPVSFDFTYQRSGEPTTAYIAQDPTGLDVAFDVTQREALTASQATNGSGVLSDDNVTVVLSPQGTKGFQYTFTANALGARYQSSSENSAYAPQWIAAAHRTPAGYVVTMHVPFDIIRSGGSTTWSVQFERTTIATNSTQVWEHTEGQRGAGDPAFAGTLTGIAVHGSAKATRPKPRVQLYGLGELTTPAYGGSTSRIGADLSLPVTLTSSLVAALHPDYSNVEIDQQTIAPTAFARRYGEVRPFFTQVGSNFNNTFSCNNCPTTLYTPAIPTFRDGYAYEGTQGRTSFAAFDAVGTGRNDSAEVASYAYSDPKLVYGASLQRVAADLPGTRDDTTTLYTGVSNQHTHLFTYFNGGVDRGTNVSVPGLANYFEYGAGYASRLTTTLISFQKIGSQFSPYDGYVNQADIAGYFAFYTHTLNFAPNAPLHDVSLSSYYGRYADHLGRPAQTDGGAQFNVDLRNLVSVHLYENSEGVETYDGELLPFNANGVYLSYKGQTATPSSIAYTSGPYSHGHLTGWSYSTTLPVRKRLNLSLEADENLYGGSPLRIEPVAKQWLERASLDWQLSRDASFDLGIRRIIGRNLPNAFQSPDLPTPQAPLGTLNGSTPFDYVSAGNVSFAFHFLAAHNEFYVVYGDPNSLATTPALFVKLIRYIGAEKGT